MNFLAHLYLSCNDEDLLIGNFMADFIKNSDVETYPAQIQKGIQLHRRIDSFTDNHPEVRKGTKRLRKNHGKYSPVVIDILYDYVLAKNWERYHGDSLENFSNDVYQILTRRKEDLPEKLSRRVPLMVADDFLTNYGKKEGISFALKRMDQRTKFPSNFYKAIRQLENEWSLFNEEFNIFFPEVIEMSEMYCNC